MKKPDNSLKRGLDGGQSISSMYADAYKEAATIARVNPRKKTVRYRPESPPVSGEQWRNLRRQTHKV